jgi:transposase-like protein
LTAGTVFEGTRKPLRMWFLAMWFVTSQKNGVSALGLQRVLGLGSYETAWTWLHKLRRAMVRPDRDCLTGAVEVDETYIGGPEEGKYGRDIETKAIVAVAAEKSGRGIGRIRLRRVKDVSSDCLLPFVQNTVAPGSVVHTDGWSGYRGLAVAGYQHQVTVISAGPEPAHEVMPRVHNVASLLKRWLLGTHQGGTVKRQARVSEWKLTFCNGMICHFRHHFLSSSGFSLMTRLAPYIWRKPDGAMGSSALIVMKREIRSASRSAPLFCAAANAVATPA